MRRLADAERVTALMRRRGEHGGAGGRGYLTGGACALLIGWRETTIDVDLMLDADADPLLRAIAELDLFEAIEPRLYRYPAIDAASFRRGVNETFSV